MKEMKFKFRSNITVVSPVTTEGPFYSKEALVIKSGLPFYQRTDLEARNWITGFLQSVQGFLDVCWG
jgi:hypothetical protein